MGEHERFHVAMWWKQAGNQLRRVRWPFTTPASPQAAEVHAIA